MQRHFNFLSGFFSLKSLFTVGLVAFSTAALADESALKILSPSFGSQVDAQTVNVEYSYDTAVFGQSPKVEMKVDGLDATSTRGMSVKGSAPQAAEKASSVVSSSSAIAETKTVHIPPRDCEVQVVITSVDGKKHIAAVRVKWTGAASAAKKEGRLLVLSIGVSQYHDDTVSALKLPAKDAKDFVQLASTQEGGFYNKVEARSLLNDQATRSNIIDALDWLEETAKTEDTVMIFLAGHGTAEGGQFYFVPHDADDDKIRRSCVGFDDVQTTATGLPSRTIVFLDACHSGGIGGGGAISTEITAVLAGWQKAKSPNGSVMFASSTGTQLSQEKVEWGNGAFTKAVLEGLKGEAHPAKAGPISIAMLENYVSKRVKDLTVGQQTPTTTRSMDMSDFDFALAGDARSEKARLEEEAFVKEAEKRSTEAVRVAFIAQQILTKRQNQIKDLEEVNSDGSFNEKIATYKKELSLKSEELSKSISELNQIAGSNGIIVGKALALREAELSEALKTASKKDADVAVSAMNHLKQKVKLPESY
jgi:uncharacterized caspase-like protein